MFDKFGEMNSYKEINELAENLLKEGDIDGLREMAKENGITEDFVEMYISDDIPYLCDAITAANGKLDLECAELKPKELMLDWTEYIRGLCMEHEEVALAVRSKGKRLEGCIGELLKWAFKNQTDIDKKLLKEAGVTAGRVTFGIPGMGRAKKIIKEYYLGGQEK